MAKSSVSTSSTETSLEHLTTAVERLTDNIRVLTDLVQATRDELQWIIRNGVPHQSLTVRIDPQSSVIPTVTDEGPRKGTVPEIDAADRQPVTEQGLHDACEWLMEEFGELTQEQLNLLVTSQNDWKREIIAAVTKALASTAPTADRPASPRPSHVVPAPASTRPSMSSIPAPTERPVVHKPRSFSFEDEESPTDSEEASPPPMTPVVSHIPPPVALSALPPVPLWEIGDAVEFEVDHSSLWGEIVALCDAENTATIELIPAGEVVTVSQNILAPEWASHKRNAVEQNDELSRLECVPATGPVTLPTLVSVVRRLEQGTISAAELRLFVARCVAERQDFIARLTQHLPYQPLRSLAAALRCLPPGRCTKETLAQHCFKALLRGCAAAGPVPVATGVETEAGIREIIERLTDDDLRVYAASVRHQPPVLSATAPLEPFVALLSRSHR